MSTATAESDTVTSNTHNPCWKSFHLEIWDISRLFTHFSLLFLALGSESHIFLPFAGWHVWDVVCFRINYTFLGMFCIYVIVNSC